MPGVAVADGKELLPQGFTESLYVFHRRRTERQRQRVTDERFYECTYLCIRCSQIRARGEFTLRRRTG